MRRIVLLILLSVTGGQVFSQRQYYLYIGAEPAQPFYVRTGDKTYSSTSAGTLILSQLKDSTYKLAIGFPGNRYPEQQFDIQVEDHDLGFELRNPDNEGWVLFNWLSGKTIKPQKRLNNNGGRTGVPRSDPFALLMAGVVNDSLVLYDQVVKENAKTETAAEKPPKLKDSASLPSISTVSQDSASEVIASSSGSKDSAVQRDMAKIEYDSVKTHSTADLSENKTRERAAKDLKTPDTAATSQPDSSTADSFLTAKSSASANDTGTAIKLLSDSTFIDGRKLVFKDLIDTVSVLIPLQPRTAVRDSSSVAPSGRLPDKDAKNVGNPLSEKTATSQKKGRQQGQKTTAHLKMINSDCIESATDHDLDKLRVQLLRESSARERIEVAKKFFKAKCYTTKQIRALSELFPEEEDRYRFFDAAYPFVSDSGNFKTLVELFSEPFYISRFNLLVHG